MELFRQRYATKQSDENFNYFNKMQVSLRSSGLRSLAEAHRSMAEAGFSERNQALPPFSRNFLTFLC
jgi:hypothetical protein